MTSLLTTMLRAEAAEQASIDPFSKDRTQTHMLSGAKGVLDASAPLATKLVHEQNPALSPGGLANAFAAATASNHTLQQTHPSNRPQPGTSQMRDLFALPWNSIYFNASYGNVPWPVMQAQWALQAQCEANPQAWMLGGVAPKIQRTRKLVARYVGCEAQDLALVENCTSGANAVLRSLRMPQGATFIHLSTAYGVIKNCMAYTAEKVGGTVVEVPVEFRGQGSAPTGAGGIPLVEAVAAALDAVVARGSTVALACFDHIASCPGVLMPVMELLAACKARGVPVMLDGAHALGQLKVDVRALEAAGMTYWISDAHKWLFSPKGSAVLWVTREQQGGVRPAALGAVVRSSASLASFKAAAVKGLSDFEMRFQYTGTRDYTPFAGIEAALEFRKLIGEETIVQYNHHMALWAQRYLADLWHTETLVPEENTVAMGHVRLPINTRSAAAKLAEMLKERCELHIMLFTLPSPTGGADTYWVRPCFQIYNTARDVELLGQYVKELAPLARVAELAAAWLARVRPEAQEAEEEEEEEEGGIWFERAPPSEAAAQPMFGQTPPQTIGFTGRMNQAAVNITQKLQRSQLKPHGALANPFLAHREHHQHAHIGHFLSSNSMDELRPSSPDSVFGGPRGRGHMDSWGSMASISSSPASASSLSEHILAEAHLTPQ